MNLRITLLWINALLSIVFGISFIVTTSLLSRLVTEAAPGTPSAMIGMRATYAGRRLIGIFVDGSSKGWMWSYSSPNCLLPRSLRLS